MTATSTKTFRAPSALKAESELPAVAGSASRVMVAAGACPASDCVTRSSIAAT